MKISDLQVGDMIKLGKSPRLIRAVTIYRKGNYKVFWFAIARPSWTGRCYTLYTAIDLKQIYKGFIKRGVPLVTNELERKVQKAIIQVAYDVDILGMDDSEYITARQMAGKVR